MATELELGILEVLRDGGAANLSDLPSLLAGVPKDSGQRSLVATEDECLEAVTKLFAAGLATPVAPGVVAWTGIAPPEWE